MVIGENQYQARHCLGGDEDVAMGSETAGVDFVIREGDLGLYAGHERFWASISCWGAS